MGGKGSKHKQAKSPKSKNIPGEYCAGHTDGRDETVSRIPKQFLNALGFIEYDHYGRKPWTSWDEAKWDIYISPSYSAITDLLGIDCEMVGVGIFKHSALGRVSIVNEYGYCIFDTFVKPYQKVTDYRTQFSGVEAEDLLNAPDVDVVLEKVSGIVASKVLIGHSIHNDLEVLNLNDHPKSLLRDTSIYFKKELKMKGIPSLRDLASKYFGFNIQTGGHSSIQDAQVTLKLYLMNREKWEEDFIKRLANANLAVECHSVTKMPDPIGDMHVEPREPDLYVDSETVFLRENKVVGAYSSCEEYLDIQFRLLMEDFLRPMRDCVQNVNKWRSFKNNSLFYDVKIEIGQNELTSEVKKSKTILVPIDRNNLRNVDWEESKMFLNGSLLVLTPDDFKSAKFAVIQFLHEIREEGSNQYFLKLRVQFSKHGPSWTVDKTNNRFMMLESPAFYEAYKHSLEYLQTVDLKKFPLKRYIVDAETSPHPPKYLLSVAKEIDFSVLMNSPEEETSSDLGPHKALPLDFKNWPNANQLNLDESQFEAFQKALTQEMTIIQGPPGTGKTFIGIQIVKLLLSNPWLLNSPILIVSYTNHALDQTLEQILDFVTNSICGGNEKKAHNKILRIGGCSKSEVIQPLVLRVKFEKYLEKKRLSKKLDVLHKILNSIKDLHLQNFCLDQGILDFQKLPKVIRDKLSQDKKSKIIFQKWITREQEIRKDPLVWFSLPQKNLNLKKGNNLFLFMFEKIFAPDLVKSINNNFKESSDSIAQDIMEDKPNILTCRWNHYLLIVKFVKDLVEEMEQTMIIFEQKYLELEHCLTKNMSIRSAVVIGMTTTGAVKHKYIVRKTKPKIMIVEEAAHVLEAHVVSSLTEHCQQMVMIGDHKQLRPMTADYNLATDYNLDVSLMERLVKNGVDQGKQNWTQLKVQHRMRPEIARMICPVIYEELYNHPDVLKYPDVKGCSKNLFFVDHCNAEGKEKGSRSYFNHYEVNFLSELVNYFVNGGYYEQRQITVIATYLAQKLMIENKLKTLMRCSEVRVSTVDGYQGEENDIILLSLVRNNPGNNVGFLKTNNRVCVALSRARHGLFMIGNMSCLKSESETWAEVNDTLTEMESIGVFMPFTPAGWWRFLDSNFISTKYQISGKLGFNPSLHEIVNEDLENSENLPTFDQIAASNSIENLPEVSHVKTKDLLPCGHERQLSTKNSTKCSIILNKTLSCGHQQKVPCYQQENFCCSEKVKKNLPCGHVGEGLCGEHSEKIKCMKNKNKLLNCGHQQKVTCHLPTSKVKCTTTVSKDLPCGHKQRGHCHQSVASVKCDVIVSCEHQEKMPCHQASLCLILTQKILPCGHKILEACSEKLSDHKCNIFVESTLSCGHSQISPCYSSANPSKCTKVTLKNLPCGHKQEIECHQDPLDILCKTLVLVSTTRCTHKEIVECHESKRLTSGACTRQCEKILKCGHQCPKLCHENDLSSHMDYQCIEKCQRSCPNGHTCTDNHECYKDCAIERYSSKKCMCFLWNVSPNATKLVILPCGHSQKLTKNKKKTKLNAVKCVNNVMKDLPCGHKQRGHCHQSVASVKCDVIVSCEHQEKMPCHQASLCLILTQKILPCGHKILEACSERLSDHKCNIFVESTLPCGHLQISPCYSSANPSKCTKVTLKNLPCGHKQEIECHQDPLDILCKTLVLVSKTRCTHKEIVECHETEKLLAGACTRKCEEILKCGHQCPKHCHENDLSSHMNYQCMEKCQGSCPKGHTCTGNHECYKYCAIKRYSIKKCMCKTMGTKEIFPTVPPKVAKLVTLPCGHSQELTKNQKKMKLNAVKCVTTVMKELPCGHKLNGPCHQSVSTIKCNVGVSCGCGYQKKAHCYQASIINCSILITKTLPCSHEVQVPCSHDVAKIECTTRMSKKLVCGHMGMIPCHEEPQKSRSPCMAVVNKLLGCGHQLLLPCSRTPFSKECTTKVLKELPCGHKEMVLCREDARKTICKAMVQKLLSCGHLHQVQCCELISDNKCTANSKEHREGLLEEKKINDDSEIVEKTLPCGHPQKGQGRVCTEKIDKCLPCGHQRSVLCNEDVKKITINCKMSVVKILSCGHQQKAACYLPISEVKCITTVMKELTCGHMQKVNCHQSVSTVKCHVGVSCEHQKEVPCYQASLINCSILITKTLPCWHEVIVPCSQNVSKMECKSISEILLPCGHLQKYFCHFRLETKCSSTVIKKLPCGHEQESECHQNPEEIQCKTLVSHNYTNCSHTVTIECFKSKIDSKDSVRHQCEKIFRCGHQCVLMCHENSQSLHGNYKCIEKCQRSCPEGHCCDGNHECYTTCPLSNKICTCRKKAFNPNSNKSQGGDSAKRVKAGSCEHVRNDSSSSTAPTPCKILITKVLPCGHKVEIPCHKKNSNTECKAIVQFSCGHVQKKPIRCLSLVRKCPTMVLKDLPCGHQQNVPCHQSPQSISCDKVVLTNCSHKVKVKCHEAWNDPVACNCQCETILDCGHQCLLVCHEDDLNYHLQIECNENCKRSCPLGHSCSGNHACYLSCPIISGNNCPKCMLIKASYEATLQNMENMKI